MAKKKDGKQQAKQPQRIPAWQELVNLLKSGSYVLKVNILAQLKALGYDITENSVSYVMTAARKRGYLCVYTGKSGYTAAPTGVETLGDIRKRRRIANAWLKNIDALIKYAEKNFSSLVQGLKPELASDLRKEIKYNKAAVKQLHQLAATSGLA